MNTFCCLISHISKGYQALQESRNRTAMFTPSSSFGMARIETVKELPRSALKRAWTKSSQRRSLMILTIFPPTQLL